MIRVTKTLLPWLVPIAVFLAACAYLGGKYLAPEVDQLTEKQVLLLILISIWLTR